mmetsp:Transcript_26456/g.41184  ORF Transcript_26456/g.41184 Transcript_26456/m.41184 type:complete len:175 (-) Transcript_26456:53-577(-)
MEFECAALFVSNLHSKATQSTVKQLFGAYGAVLSVDMYADLPQSAIVSFSKTCEADIAIVSLHGRYMMTALPLVVIYDKSSQKISEFGRNHTMRVKFSLAAAKPHANSTHNVSSAHPSKEIQNETSLNLRPHDIVSYRLKPQRLNEAQALEAKSEKSGLSESDSLYREDPREEG